MTIKRRRKLISFTDTKSGAERKKKLLSKEFKSISIKKQLGGFSVFGLKKKKK